VVDLTLNLHIFDEHQLFVYVYAHLLSHTPSHTHPHTRTHAQREIMVFIGIPIGRSKMISSATNPLKESRKESLLRCAGSTSICVWLVCDLVVICIQAVGDRVLGDLCVCVRCGPFRVRKYKSVVIGFRQQGGSC